MILSGCSLNNENERVTEVGSLQFDSISCDTIVRLTQDANSPHCRISLNLMVAKGDNAEKVNDSLIRCGILSPDYLSLSAEKLSLRQAVDSFIRRYIDDYREFYTTIFKDNPATRQAELSYDVRTWVEDGGNGVACYFANIVNTVGEASTDYVIAKNILTSNGHIMQLEDVFVPGYDKQLSEAIVDALCDGVGAHDLEELHDKGYFLCGNAYPSRNFILRKDKIEFIYITGEIADRDKDEIRIAVDYSDIKHLMKKFQPLS